MKKFLFISFVALLVASCGLIVKMTKSKNERGQLVETPLSKSANAYFWEQFHAGNYDSVNAVISQLNLALGENPNDLVTTAHLGFAHVWALSERQALKNPDASITEHLLLSKRYFQEAYEMNPHDPRLLGFLADMTIAEGNVLGDKRTVVDGYFKGLKSIKMWPQFNKFSIGYLFSILDTTDKNFSQAIDWQYETISDCACEKVDKKGNYVEAINKIKNSKDREIARACWNSWIAPHNWEGFCLNFGDMLTKKGQIEEAKKIYNLARLSDDFDHWPHRNVLEKRIQDIEKNAHAFNKPLDERNLKLQSVMLFNSRNSCTACHQMSETDQKKYVDFKGLGSDYYFPKKKKF